MLIPFWPLEIKKKNNIPFLVWGSKLQYKKIIYIFILNMQGQMYTSQVQQGGKKIRYRILVGYCIKIIDLVLTAYILFDIIWVM